MLPKLLDNEGGGTAGYDNPTEKTPNVGRIIIIIIVYDKLDGGLVKFVDADADDLAEDADDAAEYDDEYAGEKSGGGGIRRRRVCGRRN